MRVIAGSAKGIKIISPDGFETRPTSQRIKEAVFSMILPEINNCIFLDLFSGTGAMGIEALSRGAKKACFIDSSQEAIQLIVKNLQKTKLEENAVVKSMDATSFLMTTNEQFNLIYVDPPYNYNNMVQVLNHITDNDILKEDGFIIFEQDVQSPIIKEINNLEVYKIKKYAKTHIIVYKIKVIK